MSRQRFLGGLLGASPVRLNQTLTGSATVTLHTFPGSVVDNGEVVDLTTTEDANGFAGWNGDGTAFWTVGNGIADILEWPCTTAYDPSTAGTPTQHYDGVASLGKSARTMMGGCWNHDGTRFTYLYDGSTPGEGWFEIVPAGDPYTMNPATDTITSDKNRTSVTSSSDPKSCCFNADGTRFYVSYDGNDTVYAYEPATAGVSTGTLTYRTNDATATALGYAIGAMAYSSEADGIYIACQTNPIKIDLLPTDASGDFTGGTVSTFTTSLAQNSRGLGLFNGGAKAHVMNSDYKIHEIELGTGGDLALSTVPFDDGGSTSIAFGKWDQTASWSGATFTGDYRVDHGTDYRTSVIDTLIGETDKVYIEVQTNASTAYFGLCPDGSVPTTNYLGSNSTSWSHQNGDRWYHNGATTGTRTSFTSNDLTTVLMYAIDRNTGHIWAGHNGTWHRDPLTQTGNLTGVTTTGDMRFGYSNLGTRHAIINTGDNVNFNGNFSTPATIYSDEDGNGQFRYQPPTGFKALATVTDTTITRTTPNVGIMSLNEAGPEDAESGSELTQLNWGGIRGRDSVVEVPGAVTVSYSGTWGATDAEFTLVEDPYHIQRINTGSWDWRNFSYALTGTNKYYCEIYMPATYSNIMIGVANSSFSGNYAGQGTDGISFYAHDGQYYYNSSPTAYGSAWNSGAWTVGMAIDLNAREIYWSLNGTWQGSSNPSTSSGGVTMPGNIASGDVYINVADVSNQTPHFHLNTGENGTFNGTLTAGGNTDTNGVGDFKYSVPTGYQGVYTATASTVTKLAPTGILSMNEILQSKYSV